MSINEQNIDPADYGPGGMYEYEWDSEDDLDYDEEIIGYCCLCCGHTMDENEKGFGDTCPYCCSSALDKMYF